MSNEVPSLRTKSILLLKYGMKHDVDLHINE